MLPENVSRDDPCYLALKELRSKRWQDKETVARVLDPLSAIPAVASRLRAGQDLVAASQATLDLAIARIRSHEETAQPLHGRSRAYAAALLFRRPHLLTPREITHLCDDETVSLSVRATAGSDGTPSVRLSRWAATAGIGERRTAICRIWKREDRDEPLNRGTFENDHEPDVLRTVVVALHDLERARDWKRPHMPRIHAADLDVGFWWRSSTDKLIEAVAALEPTTIFAGADGHSDVGEPLHATLGQLFLEASLPPRVAATGRWRLDPEEVSEVVSYFTNRSPAYIGSMVRGIAAQTKRSQSTISRELEDIVREVTGATDDEEVAGERARRTRSFVGKSIAALAKQLASRDCHVDIVSAHNDADITEALSALDATASVQVFELHPGDDEARSEDVGTRSQEVLSEADLFESQLRSGVTAQSWYVFLQGRLRSHKAILVGTDIRSPGLVAALATTRREAEHPRYAILLPPAHGPWTAPDPRDAADAKDPEHEARRQKWHWRMKQALYYKAMAGRYLDLGVVPVIADYPYQVPQFLREVELRIEQGVAYRPYWKRCDAWWSRTSSAFGLGHTDDASPKRRSTWQQIWHEALVAMRETSERESVQRVMSERTAGGREPERLMLEVWIRNPKERELFLWATSDHDLKRSSSSPRASLQVPGGVLQGAFRSGQTQTSLISRDPWRFCAAMPLRLSGPELPEDRLSEESYHDLPIGVLRVLSTSDSGELATIADSPVPHFEEAALRLADAMMAQLPPEDAQHP